MSTLTGGCACGAVRFAVAGPPRFTILCHCRACQQMTGGGHAPQAAFPAAGFSLTGAPAHWDRTSDAGHSVAKHFCPACGAPLYSTTTRMDDVVMVLLGALDDPAAITPTMLVNAEQRLPWDHAPVEPAP